jgi:large repetitive protein
MKNLALALFLQAIAFFSFSQSVPFPPPYSNNSIIQPWGYNQVGTNWNTSPYLPFTYNKFWFRLMPPNGVTYNNSNNTWSYSEPGKKYPLILFFHGNGETGTDNNNQLRHGGERHKNAVLSGEFPGFLFYPQAVTVDQAKSILERIILELPVDINRIYVHGLSGGALKTLDFTVAYPTMVAAAFPMSGARDEIKTSNQLYTQFRWAQGEKDINPTPTYTESVVNWINTNGGHAEYFFLPNVGHGTWNFMYNRSDFFSWFLEKKKNKIEVKFNRNEICPEATISVDMGFTPGFEAYEWRKDGVLISGQTAHKLIATSYGSYTGRIRNRSVWSEWSDPVVVSVKGVTSTPPIQANGLRSVVLPAPDGSTTTELMLPEGYESYSWKNSGGQSIGSARVLTNVAPGNYTATANEFNGCTTTPSPVFSVINATGPNGPDAIASFLGYAVTESQIALSWTDKPSPNFNETGFEIYRSLNESTGFSLIAITSPDAIGYSDFNLISNTTYFYKIRPVNQYSAGPVSETIGVITQVDNIAPTAPSNLIVTGTSPSSVSLQWLASTDNVGVFKYDLYKDGAKVLATGSNSATIYNLTANQTYQFVVKARDLTGNNSTESNLVIASAVPSAFSYKYYEASTSFSSLPDFNTLTPVITGYSNFLDISVRRRDTQFAFMWEGLITIPVAGNYTFITNSDDGSKLYIGSYNEANRVVNNDGSHGNRDASGTKNFSQPGVYPIIVTYFQGGGGFSMQPLYWQNTAHGVVGKTAIPLSQFSQIPPLSGLPPVPPTSLSATPTSFSSISLSWTDNSNNETGFRIYRSLTNSGPFVPVATVSSNSTSYEDTALESSTIYFYRVTSYGEFGESALSNQVPRGLDYSYYEAPSIANLAALSNLTPVKSGNTSFFDVNLRDRNQNFGLKWVGKIYINTAATYTFYTSSDDGSNLSIDNVQVVANDFNQTQRERSGTRSLTVGWHDFEVRWRKNTSSNSRLTVSYARPGLSKRSITAANSQDLFYGTEINATTLPKPPVPLAATSFSVTNTSPTVLSLSWQDNAFDETSYQILRSYQQNTNYVTYKTLPAGTTSYVDNGLFANATYFYKVKAIGPGGSSISMEQSGVTSNNVPQLTPIADLGIKFGTTKSINLYAEDADNDPVTFLLSGLPAFATYTDYGDGSGIIQANPAPTDLGDYTITVVARDNHNGVSSDNFVMTVTDKDVPQLLPIANVNMSEGQVSNLAISATSDFGAANLVWAINGLPEFASHSISNGTCSISLTPGFIHSGSYPVSVTVTDQLGATASKNFTITVGDVDPNSRVLVNIRSNTSAPSPWNNMSGNSLTSLRNDQNILTPIGVEFLTTAWNTYNEGSVTGNNSGVFPDEAIRDYYYFGIFGIPETISVRLTGLDISKKHNFSFLGSSKWTGVPDNGSTLYAINGTVVSLRVQNNTQNLAKIKSVTPNPDGSVTFTMSKAAGTAAGFLNAFSIETLYQEGTVPAAPRDVKAILNLNAVNVSWVDAPFNEEGFDIYRSESEQGPFVKLNEEPLVKNSTTYTDNNLQNGASYFYKVVAFNDFGQSNDSNITGIALPNLPPQITLTGNLSILPDSFSMITVSTSQDATLTINGLPSFAYLSPLGDNAYDIILLPEATSTGSHTFTATATDGQGVITNTSYTIVIQESVLYRVFINMNQSVAAPAPWNNTSKAPAVNDTFSNLRNESNVTSGVNLTIVSAFGGAWNEGAQTGNNSGIVPDNVLKEYYWFGFGSAPSQVTLRVSGLSPANKYRFKFAASSVFTNGGTITNNGSTVFSIGGKSASVNAQSNTSQLAIIEDVVTNSSGQVTIVLSKGANAAAGYINGMIIEALPIDPSEFVPTNLTAAGLSSTQIVLNWNDNSPTETGYEIFRSTTGTEGSFSLIGTTAADISTFTDIVSQGGQLYHYKVRSTSLAGPSEFTNVAKCSSVAFKILVNIAGLATYDAPIPWNNVSRFGFTGDVFYGFKDQAGQETGLRMYVRKELEAANNWGMNTGNNAGVFPDNVLTSFWYNNSFQPQGEFVIEGLDQTFAYNFGFMGSINVASSVKTDFTINDMTVTNTNNLNISDISYIRNVTPDSNSEILFTVKETPGSPWSIFNALVIEGYATGGNQSSSGRKSSQNAKTGNLREVRFGEATNATTLYPNPVQSTLNISIDDASLGEVYYHVYDLMGKEMKKGIIKNELIKSDFTMDMENMPASIYLIKIVFPDGKIETQKIIKN